jgi:hypothetical protein
MIFDHYRAWVYQSEIGVAAGTTATPGIGTPLQGLTTAALYDEYESRDWGFDIDLMSLDTFSQEERHNLLKGYIDRGIPLVVLCKHSPSSAYHYKVLIGYDEGKDSYYFNDPWYTPYGIEYPDPCGPFSTVEAYAGEKKTRFERTWENAGHRIAAIRPIDVSLSLEGNPISSRMEFELNCTVDPTMLSLPADVNLELSFPSGYSLVEGPENVMVEDVDGVFNFSWRVESSSGISEEDCIEVIAKSISGETTHGGIGKIYPAVPPIPIITMPQIENESRFVTSMFDISSEVTYSGEFNVSIGVFNGTDTGIATFYHDFVGNGIYDVEVMTHVHRPGKRVFLWVEVNTIYGTYNSDILVVDIIDGDADEDGLSDYNEMVWYDSSPFLVDTDGDNISDFDEVNTYETNPVSNDNGLDTLSDYDELYVHNTNPCSNDTDSDLLPDNYEIIYGLDALTNDSHGDLDEDGLSNLQEYQYGTDPTSADTDEDGMDDASEIESGFDPLYASSNAMAQIIPLAIAVSVLIGALFIIGILVKKKMK